MTTLEKYFGIHVRVDTILDPFYITYLEERVNKIRHAAAFNIDDFFVYLHQLHVFPARQKRPAWCSGGALNNRLRELRWTFNVSQRHHKSGFIKFFNFAIDDEISQTTIPQADVFCISRTVPGNRIQLRNSYQTELITCISRRVRREKFRKIRIRIEAVPTEEYSKTIVDCGEQFNSYIDIALSKDIKLLLRDMSDEKRLDIQQQLYLLNSFKKDRLPEHKPTSSLTNINISSVASSPGAQSSAGNSNILTKDSISSTFTVDQAVSYIRERIEGSDLNRFDKSDAIDALARAKDLINEPKSKDTLDRAAETISLLESICSKSATLWTVCQPVVSKLIDYVK